MGLRGSRLGAVARKMEPGPAISITNLVKRYAGHKGAAPKLALDDVSFDVPTGQIFGLLGPNGAGKTTTFYMMIGFISAEAGQVMFDSTDISRDIIFSHHLGIGNKFKSRKELS